MPIMLDTTSVSGATIKVIGVGGGGGNAVNNMIEKGLVGVEFIAANTDIQALTNNKAPNKIQVGKSTSRGLGAGANPEVGKASMQESHDEIREILKGSDMVFVTSGMGGGTGTGGSTVVAEIAKDLGALVVGIVTKPFLWEGKKKAQIAETWIKELRNNVDALIVIPNQRLLEIIDKNTSFFEAFAKVDEVLYNATKGISDIINCAGVVNVDFADVRTVMKDMGDAIMGIGRASGENRAITATNHALNSPLLDGVSIKGSKGILVNVTGGKNMTMSEISEAVSLVEQSAGGDVNVIHGVVYNDEIGDDIMVTVVATGFNKVEQEEALVETLAAEITPEIEQPVAVVVNSEFKTFIQGRNQNVAVGGFGQSVARTDYSPEHSEVATHYDSSPKGEKQLEKFNSPAFLRRSAMNGIYLGQNNNTNGKARVEKINEVTQTSMDNRPKLSEQPAFLRKIMD